MLRKKRYLYLRKEEVSILLNSLIQLKNSLIQQGRYTDYIDELILKVMQSPMRPQKILCNRQSMTV